MEGGRYTAPPPFILPPAKRTRRENRLPMTGRYFVARPQQADIGLTAAVRRRGTTFGPDVHPFVSGCHVGLPPRRRSGLFMCQLFPEFISRASNDIKKEKKERKFFFLKKKAKLKLAASDQVYGYKVSHAKCRFFPR